MLQRLYRWILPDNVDVMPQHLWPDDLYHAWRKRAIARLLAAKEAEAQATEGSKWDVDTWG